MPTGYTAEITSEKGISFKDFVMNCARAFGACVTMRDDPNDKEIPIFKVSDYHPEELRKAEKELTKFKKLTEKDWGKKAKQKFDSEIKDYEKRTKEYESSKDKYDKMLVNVKNWTPPTKDHTELKSFMEQQITSSAKFDCYTPEKPKIINGQEWANQELESILWNVEYHSKENKKEIERVTGRNKWIKELRESLLEEKNV